MLLVNRAHECCSWRQDLVDENEDRLLGGELDSFTNDVYELTDSQILQSDKPYEYRPLACKRTEGTRYFFLSIVGISVRSAFSHMTYGW